MSAGATAPSAKAGTAAAAGAAFGAAEAASGLAGAGSGAAESVEQPPRTKAKLIIEIGLSTNASMFTSREV